VVLTPFGRHPTVARRPEGVLKGARSLRTPPLAISVAIADGSISATRDPASLLCRSFGSYCVRKSGA
jgi:hypothetical protein